MRNEAFQRHSKRVLAAGFVVFVYLFATAFFPSGVAFADNLQVSLGGGTVTNANIWPGSTITAKTNQSFSSLVVGDPRIADVVPLSDHSLYIQGKTEGSTTVSIYDENKELLGIVDVRVQLNYADLQSALRSALPQADIHVTGVNNRIRLSGVVPDTTTQDRALDIAKQYSSDPVINAMILGGAQQVTLEVRVLEAKRDAGRDLGINILGNSRAGPSAFGPRVQVNVDSDTKSLRTFVTSGSGGNQQGTPFGTLVANVLSTAGLNIDVMIDALEQKGLVRTLAEPNLTTVSGEVAKFHAGGEVPIQTTVSNGSGVGTQTDYRPYGVRLEFLPTVLNGSKINLRVMTEVSELDRSVVVNGNPGFTSRRADTVSELRDGQSFALAGLLQNTNNRSIQQVPWLGNIPVLGSLFRSTSFQKHESDLVIVITPHIVRPAAPNEKIASPLDSTRSTDDYELFALGLLEVNKDMIRSFRDGDGVVGPYGHRIDLGFGGVHVSKK